MSRPLFTASATERTDLCPASAALPHVSEETEYTGRGRALHQYLEDLAGSDRETALAAVPDEFRDAAAALDLSGLESLLSTAGGAEISIAIDVPTWRARELGRGEGRAYGTVTATEIACTIDVARVDGRRGLVLDWKSGWSRKLAEGQLRFCALAASLLWGLDDVAIQQVNVSAGAPWIRRAHLGRFDLAVIRDEIGGIYERADRHRAEVAAGKLPTEYHLGEHCGWCPSRRVCPAMTTQLAAIVRGDHPGTMSEPLEPVEAVNALRMIRSARKRLHLMESAIIALAGGEDGPLYLGPDADGGHHWLGQVVKPGNERIDGPIGRKILAGLHGDEVAAAAVRETMTKKDLEAAVRKIAPPRKGAAYIREALDLIRAVPGGTVRKPSVSVDEFVTKSADRPPPPLLPAPSSSTDDAADE